MIVQDEEECINRALDNIIELIDEIVIFDSGSTDRTLEIIEEYKANVPPIRVYHHPFEGNFAAQRNRCIEKATGDWILIMDADETFDDDTCNSLQRLCENEFFDLYAFTRRTRIGGYLHNLFNHDYHARLFRNNGKIKYVGNIHESLTGYERMQLCNLTINHDKKAEWQQKDNERVWDLGQTPPPGWRKVDDKWEYFRETPEKPHYLYPDKSVWDEDDPRVSMLFDEEQFRQWYNEAMSQEQKALPEGWIDFCPTERLVADEIKRKGGGALLDIGCGCGKFLTGMLHQGLISEGTGIDISDEMVTAATMTALNNNVIATIFRSSIESMPYDKKYDIVTCFESLEHIYALRDALLQIRKLLIPGGLFAGSVPWMKTCDSPTHLHYFSEESLTLLLQEYFGEVSVTKLDLTGMPEYHLIFHCVRS